MEGIIYRFVNLVNGKMYIGQTTRENKRYAAHRQCKPNCAFHFAIRKHGWENFEYSVLHRIEYDKKELDRLEIEEIKNHGSMLPRGYNMDSGGSAGIPGPHVRKKMSDKAKARIVKESTKEKMRIAMKGRKYKPEALVRMSESCKKRYQDQNERDKLSAINGTPVRCIETGISYLSIAQAIRLTGDRSVRGQVRKLIKNTASKLHWELM